MRCPENGTDRTRADNSCMDIENQRPARSPEIPQSPEAIPPDDQESLPIDPDALETADQVEEASDESFPASDPPSHSGSTATKN